MIDPRRYEFIKLYLTGEYTNRSLAKKYDVSEQTICKWINASQLVKYYEIRKTLESELNILVKAGNYLKNAEIITNLITDIERIDNLILKTKY